MDSFGKAGSSKALLDLEANPENKSSSSLDLKLCVDKKQEFLKPRAEKGKGKLSDKKPEIMQVPESQVLGKLKDFLGVIAESNKQLENNAKEDSGKYDIEVLTGKESEYIELDLMLGVADLHTPEAVAAAESAIADYQHPISLDDSSSDDDDDCSDEEKDENETALNIGNGYSTSRKTSTKRGSKKRQKIVEMIP